MPECAGMTETRERCCRVPSETRNGCSRTSLPQGRERENGHTVRLMVHVPCKTESHGDSKDCALVELHLGDIRSRQARRCGCLGTHPGDVYECTVTNIGRVAMAHCRLVPVGPSATATDGVALQALRQLIHPPRKTEVKSTRQCQSI